MRFAPVMFATARFAASTPRGAPALAPAVHAYSASTAYSGATASTASTAMANAGGTSFSAVSAPHASRNDAPRTATPLTATVVSSPKPYASGPPVRKTPTHAAVNSAANASAVSGCRSCARLIPTLTAMRSLTLVVGASYGSRK